MLYDIVESRQDTKVLSDVLTNKAKAYDNLFNTIIGCRNTAWAIQKKHPNAERNNTTLDVLNYLLEVI